MALETKIDSNVTGLRIAEEASLKVLPATADIEWIPREPNAYAEFGGQVTTVARDPINPDRMPAKGVSTDLNVSGGWSEDLTQKNFQNIGQGYLFAAMRRKPETLKRTNGRGAFSFAHIPITNVDGATERYTLAALQATVVVGIAAGGTGYVTGDTVTLTGGTFTTATVLTITAVAGAVTAAVITTPGRYTVAPGSPVAQGSTSGVGTGATFTMTYALAATFLVGHLIFVSGMVQAANNGLKRVTALTGSGTILTVAENIVNETPSATLAEITAVGIQGAAGDIDVDNSGSLPALTSTALNFTTLGLVVGEYLFDGGDTAITRFTNAANNGFKRIRTIAATRVEFDKSDLAMVTEASTIETVQLFFGRVLKNEVGSLIQRRTYQQERELGAPDNASPSAIQAEYLTGGVPSEAQFNIPSADKVTVDYSFVNCDHETIDGPTANKSGARPAIEDADAFNTSSDFTRLNMSQVVAGSAAPAQLFAFVTDITLKINNNTSPNKAVKVFGAFEITAGKITVGGTLTAYFADVAAIAAVRNNADVTLDMAMVKQNAGIVIDIPLIALGNGRLNVEKDKAITLPLEITAARGSKIDANLNYEILFCFFDYLPTAAQ